MPDAFCAAEVQKLSLGSAYILDAFREAERAIRGERAVLSSEALEQYIIHTSERARKTLGNTIHPRVQLRRWAQVAVEEQVIERVAQGGGRGRQTDYALTLRGRGLAGLPIRGTP